MGQCDNELWFIVRKGRLTTSKHHEIFTKMNSVIRLTGEIEPKTTPLVSQILNSRRGLNTDAVKWGIDNEANALKCFHAANISKQFKTEKAGLVLLPSKPFIGASPDACMVCKCHGNIPLEIKCPFKIRDKIIAEGVNDCEFYVWIMEELDSNRSHKYFTQITSQIALTGSKFGIFIVWTTKDLFIEEITFDQNHWRNVETNLDVFFKTLVARALLMIKPLTYCCKCVNCCFA